MENIKHREPEFLSFTMKFEIFFFTSGSNYIDRLNRSWNEKSKRHRVARRTVENLSVEAMRKIHLARLLYEITVGVRREEIYLIFRIRRIFQS